MRVMLFVLGILTALGSIAMANNGSMAGRTPGPTGSPMSRTHSRPTFHHQYGLTMTVVGGSFDALYDLGVKMRTWIVQVGSERYGFPEIWEEGAARVGIRRDGAPAGGGGAVRPRTGSRSRDGRRMGG